MPYLILTIFAVIVLVALAVRRLPYLRHYRLGLEIAAPKPYIGKPNPWANILNQIQSFFQGLFQKRNFSSPASFLQSGPTFTPPREPKTDDAPEFAKTAHPGDFWQDEPLQSAHDPLELPAKGLISRRGESQKIAHELVTHADEAFRKKDYKEAEKYYLQAAAKDPENARIYNRLGVIYLQIKNYKDAIEAFRRALKFDDRVASRHFNLALAYLGKRDFRSAEKCLREGIRLEPTNEKYRKTLEAIHKHTI